MKLEQYIDHTLLKPIASAEDIKRLCKEAITNKFFAVCVNSVYVPLASHELKGSDVKLAAVIGFPLGAMATKVKMQEATYCIEQGADEIDMVINLGWLKSGAYSEVLEELKLIKAITKDRVLKVIIETCYLSDKEIVKASELVVESGADFVKTSTGFGTGGATFKDVALMKATVGDKVKIKASGGIRDRETALKYVELGVSRLGTSSGTKII
ncbi:MAG: deoxyribose-phosphate aldolase [Flavobacteriaceae bacterium]